GRYRGSFHVRVSAHGGAPGRYGGSRAEAVIYNDAPEAPFVEFASWGAEPYRVLARAAFPRVVEMSVPGFPEAESAVLYALVPALPDIRFVTVMPAGDPDGIVAKVRRISGANRDIHVDRPIIDIDVFGPISQVGNVSSAAREIQSSVQSLMGVKV